MHDGLKEILCSMLEHTCLNLLLGGLRLLCERGEVIASEEVRHCDVGKCVDVWGSIHFIYDN